MKRSSLIVLTSAGVSLLVGGGLLFAGAGSKSLPPEQLIAQSLEDAEKAAKNRNASGVIEIVSDEFKSGVWDKRRLNLYLVRALRQSRGTEYDVRVNAPRILPSPKGKPDERLVVSKMSAFYRESGEDIWGSGPLTMIMRKETRRKWLLFEDPAGASLALLECLSSPQRMSCDPSPTLLPHRGK